MVISTEENNTAGKEGKSYGDDEMDRAAREGSMRR